MLKNVFIFSISLFADEIYEIINNTEKTRIAEVLVDRANENGGGDNISVAAISY